MTSDVTAPLTAAITEAEKLITAAEFIDTELDLADSIARPWTYETDPDGTLGLIADRTQRTLIGAWAIAPQAGEWIHTAALAIRAQISIDTLLDGVAQFPTYTEAYLAALEQLAI